MKRPLVGRIRKVSHEVGVGVVQALQEGPGGEEPGWRAERMARGAMRGIDEGLDDEHLRLSIGTAVEGAVQTAFSAALSQSAKARALSEDVARAFTRGALTELRGAGRGAANAITRPLVLCSIALFSVLLIRRALLRYHQT